MVEEVVWGIEFIGDCLVIFVFCFMIERVFCIDLLIMIYGENGMGKEVVVWMVYYLSDWRDELLVVVNCVVILEIFLESELFGYEKGVFIDVYE